jgi:hypothetical protein
MAARFLFVSPMYQFFVNCFFYLSISYMLCSFFLSPKSKGPQTSANLRRVHLLMCFKFITKSYSIGLSPIDHRTISMTQYAFIKGKHIHKGWSYCKRSSMRPKLRNLREFSLNWTLRRSMTGVSYVRSFLEKASTRDGSIGNRDWFWEGGIRLFPLIGRLGFFFMNEGGEARGPAIVILFELWWKP